MSNSNCDQLFKIDPTNFLETAGVFLHASILYCNTRRELIIVRLIRTYFFYLFEGFFSIIILNLFACATENRDK